MNYCLMSLRQRIVVGRALGQSPENLVLGPAPPPLCGPRGAPGMGSGVIGLLEGKQDKIMEPKIRHKCDYFLRTIKRNRNRLPILKPLTNTANITKPGQIVVLPAQHTCIVLFLKKYYLSQFYTD